MYIRCFVLLFCFALLSPALAAHGGAWGDARAEMAALNGLIDAQEHHANRSVSKAAAKAARLVEELDSVASSESMANWFRLAPKAVSRMARLAKKAAKAGDSTLANDLNARMDEFCHVSRDLLLHGVYRLKERSNFQDSDMLLRAISRAEQGIEDAERLHETGRPAKKVVKRLAKGSRLVLSAMGR